VAITLPDFTALPDVTPRAVGGVPNLPAEDPGAAGLAALGKGVTAAGGAIVDIAAYRQVARNRMEQALADASFLGRSVKLDAEVKRETDPEKITQLGQTYQAALADAGASIADPGARELWLAHNAHKVATGQAHADLRNTDIYHDRYRAGADAQMADQINIATSHEDPGRRGEAQRNIGEIIEGLKASGSISADKAQELVTKTGQNIILGHAAYLDATERSGEAKTFLEQNAQHVPSHLLDPRLHTYRERAKVQQGEALADRPVGDAYWTPEGLAALRPTEGRYDQIHYPSGDPSTASGAYGFLDRTWREQAPKAGVDITKYPRAYMAPPAAQDAVAAITPISHWTGVDSRGVPFNAAAQRLAANPAYITGATRGAAPAGVAEPAAAGPAASGDIDLAAPAAAAPGAALPAGTPAAVSSSAAARQSVLDIEHRYQQKLADIESADAPQEVKDIAARKATARYNREKATVSDFARKEAATVTKLSRDDEASIINTGVPVAQLTTDRVRNALGDDAAEAFDERRTAQLNYYENWHDMENLTQPEIDARLLETKPKPGAPGFLANQTLYDLAHKNADALRKQRIVDPAESVAKAPAVAAAQESASLERPETYIPLVAARGMAMDSVGIPKANQVPITNAEALELWKPIGLVTEGGKPQEIRAELARVITTLQAATGDQANMALEAVLRAGHAGHETAGTAASVLKKLTAGDKLTQTDTKAFDDAQKDDAAARAAAPVAPGIFDVNTGLLMPPPQPSVAPGRPPPTFPAPSGEAVQLLGSQPERAGQFDAVYGPGASAKVLRIIRPDLKPPANASAPR
jgi:hypothetical protein